MKSTFFLTAATLFVTVANAQVTDTTTQTGNTTTSNTSGTTTMGNTSADTTKKLNSYGSYSTRDSIAAKYKLLPMPGGLTVEKTFPILGTYQLNGAATATDASGSVTGTQNADTTTATAPMVTIVLDSASKGIVWVDGLEQGRIKAYLKKSPATYRIVAQKSETGKAVSEGTMHLDTTTNTLHIALGAPYNDADPVAVFATTEVASDATTADAAATIKAKSKTAKAKAKPVIITAVKVDAAQQTQGTQMQQNSTGGLQQNNEQ